MTKAKDANAAPINTKASMIDEPTLADKLEPCADHIKQALARGVSVAAIASNLEKSGIVAASPQQIRKIFNQKGWMPETKPATKPAGATTKPAASTEKAPAKAA